MCLHTHNDIKLDYFGLHKIKRVKKWGSCLEEGEPHVCMTLRQDVLFTRVNTTKAKGGRMRKKKTTFIRCWRRAQHLSRQCLPFVCINKKNMHNNACLQICTLWNCKCVLTESCITWGVRICKCVLTKHDTSHYFQFVDFFSYAHFYWWYMHGTLFPFKLISSGCNAFFCTIQTTSKRPHGSPIT